ncbi:demethylmenaquinone methyltransferase [Brachybacterium sp. DNPG3]
MSRADLDKKPYDVAGMFDSIAARYDITNDVAALGQVRMWRAAMVDSLGLGPGSEVLDLAAGTGTSSAAIADAGARVVAADFSLGMMAEGRRRGAPVPFVGADAQHLPFADDSFDAAVISFGLRNVQQPKLALAEMTRVVRPGGRVVVCEFSTPASRMIRTVYEKYLLRALPAVARRVATSSDAYDYLAESILDWPTQEQLKGWFLETGLEKVQYRNLTGGIVALHRGIVQGADDEAALAG